MQFYSLKGSNDKVKQTLEVEYKNAREIGVIKLGEEHFFFRKKFKVYYIEFAAIERCFRRVYTVPAKLCCGRGDFAIENLVICIGEEELAEIQLPGTNAAKILMEELKQKMPDAQFSNPNKGKELPKENE